MMDRLIDVTANAVADRLGTTTDGPETQITATSLVGMFRVQQRAIGRLANGVTGPHELQQRVRSEVRRAATVIERGVQAGRGLGHRREANRDADS